MKSLVSTCAWLFVALVVPGPAGSMAQDFDATTNTVGHEGDLLVTPMNQIVAPAGMEIRLPGLRPQALALSPDGQKLVTSGLTHEIVVLDPASGKILQRIALPAGDERPTADRVPTGMPDPDKKGQLSFTGLVFSPDGSHLYLSNVDGDIKVFAILENGKIVPFFSIPLPPANAPYRKDEIPAGLALSRDGKRLYVALNLSNRLAELDTTTGRVLRIWDVGVAPFDVALAGHKIYVSNWGGRRPDTNSVTGPAGRGMLVRVDSRSIANEGSVSVIDLDTNAAVQVKEILTGLHACALARSPDGKHVVVANAGSDTLTVIDTRSDAIVESICARQNPGDQFGAQPNALAFDRSGKKLFVCNGTQNAVAVFRFKPGKSEMLGLIPVGWFPGAVVYDAHAKKICVANIKDIASRMQAARGGARGPGFNTHQYAGSLSLVDLPPKRELVAYTKKALANLRYPLIAASKLPARADRVPQAVPERVGEPSLIQHVIYIIKENRTYDQVLGDAKEGNGSGDLCIFGEHVTPNQHKLVRDFLLLDNTYCASILSADGHQWTDSALATDYVERGFAGWPRSYPAGGFGYDGADALAYSPAGFIWDNALAHGKTVRDFGEFTSPVYQWKDAAAHKAKPTFLDNYRNFIGGSNAITYACEPDIEALRPYLVTNTIGWDLDVPDIFRAAQFITDLKKSEATGEFPNLVIVWLPNDHTSGADPGSPTPEAQVADNDLAMGQIFEAVSHSRFWTNTCIFAVEDDPQNGWDHVSGYRTTAYLASPYARRHVVISTQYNQTSLLRTMELMLGLPPMNQMGATATPMFDCFTNTPDLAPFVSVANQVPLDEMNPPAKAIADPALRKDAYVSARLPLDKEDQCPEDLFNHILWRAMKGSHTPYPDWAVKPTDDD